MTHPIDDEAFRVGLRTIRGLRRYRFPEQDRRVQVPLRTGFAVAPTDQAQMTVRSDRTFHPMRMMISGAGTAGGTADWIVNDIAISHRSQFVQDGAIPGDMFATNAIDTFISFERVPAFADITVTVTYIGNNDAGAEFMAMLVGEATGDREAVEFAIDDHVFRFIFDDRFVVSRTKTSIDELDSDDNEWIREEIVAEFRQRNDDEIYAVDEKTGLVVLSISLNWHESFEVEWDLYGWRPDWLEPVADGA